MIFRQPLSQAGRKQKFLIRNVRTVTFPHEKHYCQTSFYSSSKIVFLGQAPSCVLRYATVGGSAVRRTNDDKGSVRIDANSAKYSNFSAYYFIDATTSTTITGRLWRRHRSGTDRRLRCALEWHGPGDRSPRYKDAWRKHGQRGPRELH